MEKTTTKTAAACGGGGGGGEDFLIEILVRLPVVSLLRFKSVCKSWLQLIKSSFFIDLHTATTTIFNSSSSNSNQQQQLGGGGGGGYSFILQAQQYERSSDLMLSEILMLSSESGYGSKYGDWYWDIDGSLHKLYNLELPYSCGINGPSGKLSCGEVIAGGSCNGLICIVSEENDLMCLNIKKYMAVSLWLWNPATRQSRILPKSLTTTSFTYFTPSAIEISRVSFHIVAFGFDVKTKDYKVVQITYLKDPTTGAADTCAVQVYSLSTDSWRLLEDINSLPGIIPNIGWLLYHHHHHHHHGLYLNGCCFFVASSSAPKSSLSLSSSSNDDCFIISFDFTKEIFNTIRFPHPDHHQKKKRWYLSCLGDKLALFTIRDYTYMNNDDDYGYGDCDIWVLNENGGSAVIKDSWTKLHSFQIKRRRAREWIIPRGLLNNGEFALLETISTVDRTKTKMQLYNLITSKEAKTDFPIWDAVPTVLVYKPSLVSITTDRVIGGAI